MAKIIYKEGLEGQNRLDCIEGIEIELLNGQKVLIYPKYAERALLENEKISEWGVTKKTEIEALKLEDTGFETIVLLSHDSPAAKWVAEFYSNKCGTFNLPSLIAAMEIQYQRNDIDALAETIEGADLLRDFNGGIWSCSRSSEVSGWFVKESLAHAFYCNLCYSSIAVPIVLYR